MKLSIVIFALVTSGIFYFFSCLAQGANNNTDGISRADLILYSVLSEIETECDIQITAGVKDWTTFNSRSFGYRTIKTNVSHFNFVRPRTLPEPFEAVILTARNKASDRLQNIGIGSQMTINTQNKKIIGITIHEYLGLEPDGKEAWAYKPCGLTKLSQIKDLNPSCNCSEGH